MTTTRPPEATMTKSAQQKQQLDEAIENLAYWKRRAFLATNPAAKADCLARVALWTSTRNARRHPTL